MFLQIFFNHIFILISNVLFHMYICINHIMYLSKCTHALNFCLWSYLCATSYLTQKWLYCVSLLMPVSLSICQSLPQFVLSPSLIHLNVTRLALSFLNSCNHSLSLTIADDLRLYCLFFNVSVYLSHCVDLQEIRICLS